MHPTFAFFCARIRKVHSSTQQSTRLTELSDFLYRISKCSRADHSAIAALNTMNVANWSSKPIAASLGSAPFALIGSSRVVGSGTGRGRAVVWGGRHRRGGGRERGSILPSGGFTMCVVSVVGYFDVARVR